MKILYINRPKFDYLQDFIYSGLIKLVGSENIIEMPWNIKYHMNFRPYPKNIGVQKGNLFQSIKNLHYDLENIDVVIVASCHKDTIEQYGSVINKISDSVPRIFIDGGDWDNIAGDLDRLGGKDLYNEIIKKRPFDFIFKREYSIQRDYPENVIALPMCFNMDLLPTEMPKSYKYDVAFWAVESHSIRTQALDLLENNFDCSMNGTVKNQIMKKYKRKGTFYLQELASCKIGLNFRGAGWDTLRYWEIPAVGGFMISQRPQILIENNFVDGEEIIFCKDDLSDLIELCEYYLKNETARASIAQKAKIKLQSYHSNIERAKKILIKSNLRFDLKNV